jgi:hypothetical protein
MLVAATVMVVAGTVSAHRLDECLQAARIAVEPEHIELEVSLTPGIDVADQIVSDIDRDGDRSFSTGEQQAFATRVLVNLDLMHDGHPVQLAGAVTTFPDVDAVRRGEGTIHLRSTAALPAQTEGQHRVSFQNRYRPDISVYLANALVPESSRIAVTAQRRDTTQRDLTIDYVMRGDQPGSMSTWVLGGVVVALGALLIRR